MLTLPPDIMAVLTTFAPVFSRPVWRHALVLLIGAILAPGQRMVSSVLRVLGLDRLASFQTYHRVLNRDVWSSLQVSRVLVGLLVAAFAMTGPIVVGIDETIERRRGATIAAKGIYRDPVRSSHGHFVKASGLRWISLLLLVPIPWAARTWALPVLTALAPSTRYDAARGRRHKTITDWARQLVLVLHHWLPQRRLVVVGDETYAVIPFLARCRDVATLVTRLRLDARLFAPPLPRSPGQKGRSRIVGQRLPSLEQQRDDPTTCWTPLTVPHWYGQGERAVEVVSYTALWYHPGMPPVPIRWVLIRDPDGRFPTQALLCTDQDATPLQILSWFVLRWQVEVTFHAVRAHLGVETQRQWSDRAIARTTPALLGLFSLVTLLADRLIGAGTCPIQRAAWYAKPAPTFADALALVRRSLWREMRFCMSPSDADMIQVPRALVDRLTDLLCYAA